MTFTCQKMAYILGVACPEGAQDLVCQRVHIDTRTMQPGDVFAAFKGQQVDGHDLIGQAAQAGAVIALVERPVESAPIPCLMVKDVAQALQGLAAWVRNQITVPVIAVTGSCGKTGVKNFLRSIFSEVRTVLATEGNLNNQLGLPLTLLRYAGESVIVLEMGTDHPGEIEVLCKIARPIVSVVTMADASHLAGFVDVDAIAQEKGQVYVALEAHGVAVLPADSPYLRRWKTMAGQAKQINFGDSEAVFADSISHNAQNCAEFILHLGDQQAGVKLSVLGAHQIHNALAAASCAHALGLEVNVIAKGLEKTQAQARRLVQMSGLGGCQLIDDSYNASPRSVRAAIDVLAKQSGKRIAVLGDMLELGSKSNAFHFEIGEYAKAQGIDVLYAFGPESTQTAAGFGASAQHFMDIGALIEQLKIHCQSDAKILIKASNGMKLDRVVHAVQLD